MAAPRKFDHDQARARYQAGETITEIARDNGVAWNAVARVVRPDIKARLDRNSRLWRLGICEECRGPCLSAKHAAKRLHGAGDGRELCAVCRRRAMRDRFLFTHGGLLVEVRCFGCQRWLDPDEFSRGARYKDVRPGGIHSHCRACLTKDRRAYREARKVPCSHGCGKLVLHERRDPGKPPECRSCANRRTALERARKAAA